MAPNKFLFFIIALLLSLEIHSIYGVTDTNDAAALQSLKDSWRNTPPSWAKSNDPCQDWEGVSCNNSRVTALDFSFNKGLTGSLSPRLGDLQKLSVLILAGCSFTGNIPDELGNLADLSFLALNSNNFSGRIPTSLGKLSKFHFNKNQLSGSISPQLFSYDMVLIHVFLDGNQLTGTIPDSLGSVQTLEVLRLDRNDLSDKVPSNLNNLTNLNELNLAHNNFTGPIPDLSLMNSLNYVDLSNNSFDPSEAPIWFSTLPSLTTLVMEFGSLEGRVPEKLFSFSQIQQVKLRNNMFNGSFSFGDSFGSQLSLVDLENNQITSVTLSSSYTNSLMAPSFRDLSSVTLFHSIEMSLWVQLNLTPGSVFLQNPFFNTDDYLQVHLALFPSPRKNFNESEVERIGLQLSKQTYKPPKEFGPYYFIASPYAFH
ncbi:hypothetical protein EZV62_015888 [Acer yangbiense]|uniref:non-specific serine/threonine protein kinase n=1 Tax=Acer yangbiense TaxID=1000413 RepID=A0A5C7HMM5_9ROSI|nr:hypothetical protein EZV62_015888 [Acer yangbiense]